METKATVKLPALSRLLNQSPVLLRLDIAKLLHWRGAGLMLAQWQLLLNVATASKSLCFVLRHFGGHYWLFCCVVLYRQPKLLVEDKAIEKKKEQRAFEQLLLLKALQDFSSPTYIASAGAPWQQPVASSVCNNPDKHKRHYKHLWVAL